MKVIERPVDYNDSFWKQLKAKMKGSWQCNPSENTKDWKLEHVFTRCGIQDENGTLLYHPDDQPNNNPYGNRYKQNHHTDDYVKNVLKLEKVQNPKREWVSVSSKMHSEELIQDSEIEERRYNALVTVQRMENQNQKLQQQVANQSEEIKALKKKNQELQQKVENQSGENKVMKQQNQELKQQVQRQLDLQIKMREY